MTFPKITRTTILTLCLFLATALFFTFPAGDADFGWHLRYGEYFLNTGKILRANEFTWAMPDYQWANHSWGFDVICAALFNGHRFWIISLSGGILIAAAVLIIAPVPSSIGVFVGIGTYWIVTQYLLTTGLRSQLFSLVLTAILWRLLMKLADSPIKKIGYKRWHLLFPLLFLCWANLHGQFIYGLGLMGLVVAVLFFQAPSRQGRLYLVLLQLGCFLITFINPFTYRLWTTAASHLNAPELAYINEWLPIPLSSPLMIVLIMFTGVIWWEVSRTRQKLAMILPLAAMTILALTSRRIVPYYLLVSLPILITFSNQLIPKRWQRQTVYIILTVLLVIVGIVSFSQRGIFFQSWNTYCRSNVYCSEAAVQFIRNHHLQGKLWNAYRLGGYLDYRLPELKPMIDGRMTVWRDQQGASAFLDYTQMVYVFKGARDLFLRVNPDYVLIQPQYPLASVLKDTEKWPIIFADEQVYLFQNPTATPSASLSH